MRSAHPIKAMPAIYFAVGYGVGSVLVTFVAWAHDGSWLSGPVIAALSAPTSAAYCAILLLLFRRYLPAGVAGFAVAGAVCPLFPTFNGFFPVYMMKPQYAVTTAAAQIISLVALVVVFALIDFGRQRH